MLKSDPSVDAVQPLLRREPTRPVGFWVVSAVLLLMLFASAGLISPASGGAFGTSTVGEDPAGGAPIARFRLAMPGRHVGARRFVRLRDRALTLDQLLSPRATGRKCSR